MIISENDITDLLERIRLVLRNSPDIVKTYLRLARMVTKLEKEV